MSIIAGIRKPFDQRVGKGEMLHFAAPTKHHAPDGTFVQTEGRVGMAFQPHHTTERSRLESQPVADSRGNFAVFDGRLDNHVDLRNQLKIERSDASDSFVALAAFARWKEQCFSRFIGDWAVAFWDAHGQVVYLARDHAGSRTLYFQNNHGTLMWSTFLDNFCQAVTSPPPLDVDYISCYLGCQPLRDLTPYSGIRAVSPAHYVAIADHTVTSRPHWNWRRCGRRRLLRNKPRPFQEQ